MKARCFATAAPCISISDYPTLKSTLPFTAIGIIKAEADVSDRAVLLQVFQFHFRKSVSTTSHHESHKGDGLLIHAQRVGIHLATGQEQRIIIVGVGVS
jgi:hypothetical protein